MMSDYRILGVQTAYYNNRKMIFFKAYKRHGNSYRFIGQFKAPPKTAISSLWIIAAKQNNERYL